MVLLNLVATWSLPLTPTHPGVLRAPLAKGLERRVPSGRGLYTQDIGNPERALQGPRDTLGTLGAAKSSRDTFGTLGTLQTPSWALCTLWGPQTVRCEDLRDILGISRTFWKPQVHRQGDFGDTLETSEHSGDPWQ